MESNEVENLAQTKSMKNESLGLTSPNVYMPIVAVAAVFILGSLGVGYLVFAYPLIVAALTIRRIEYGLSFILLTASIQFTGFYPYSIGPLHPNSLQVMSMILFLCISLLKVRHIKIRWHTKVFFLLTLWIAMSLIWTPARFEGFKMFSKFVVMLLALTLFSNIEINIRKVLKLIIIGGLFSTLLFGPIFYGVLGNEIVSTEAGRFRIMGGAFIPTAWALVLGVCFIASIILFDIQRRPLYFMSIVYFFGFIMATNTRIAWAASFFIIVLYLIYKKAWVKLGVIGFIAVFIALNVLASAFLLTDASEDTKKTQLEVFTQGRSVLWAEFWQDFTQKPIFGLGFEYTTLYSEERTGIFSLHSDPLRILYDLGIIGFVLYLTFMMSIAVMLLMSKEPYRLIMLLFAFYFMTSLTGNVFNYIQAIGIQTFMLLGMTMFVYYKDKDKLKDEQRIQLSAAGRHTL